MENMGKYDDIILLSRHGSGRRASMRIQDRAAQFSPFAALTGYDAAIQETARLTDQAAFLDESSVQILDEMLRRLKAEVEPRVTVTYFRPDGRKTGGAYVCVTGVVKKVDELAQSLILTDGQSIPFGQIYGIESADCGE